MFPPPTSRGGESIKTAVCDGMDENKKNNMRGTHRGMYSMETVDAITPDG